MEAIKRFFADIKGFLDVPVTKIGSTEITLWIILYEVFQKNNIEIPFPQRDIYIKEIQNLKNLSDGQ